MSFNIWKKLEVVNCYVKKEHEHCLLSCFQNVTWFQPHYPTANFWLLTAEHSGWWKLWSKNIREQEHSFLRMCTYENETWTLLLMEVLWPILTNKQTQNKNTHFQQDSFAPRSVIN